MKTYIYIGAGLVGAAALAFTLIPHHKSPLSEGGQGGFAALVEVVEALNKDTSTDWSRVDIPALHMHLIDMDVVFSQTDVATQVTDTEVVFTLQGSARALGALGRMLPAHAKVLREDQMFDVTATLFPPMLTLTYADSAERQKILALGFYGIMATGAHHPAHHWAMARGSMGHAH